MDNGLIFPYPQNSAHTEPGDTNHPLLLGFRVWWWRVGSELVVGKRWGDAGG
jgi:hypothetical protein